MWPPDIIFQQLLKYRFGSPVNASTHLLIRGPRHKRGQLWESRCLKWVIQVFRKLIITISTMLSLLRCLSQLRDRAGHLSANSQEMTAQMINRGETTLEHYVHTAIRNKDTIQCHQCSHEFPLFISLTQIFQPRNDFPSDFTVTHTHFRINH